MNRYAPTPYSYNNSSQNGSAKMIESIITLFDDHGKLIWDNSLKFDNIKRYAPEQTSDFLVKNGLTVSAYKKEKEILMSTGTLGENPEPDTMRILLKNVTDIIRHESEEDSGVRFWNENILIVWGYQSLRDNSKPEGDQVRYVFYINKIEIN